MGMILSFSRRTADRAVPARRGGTSKASVVAHPSAGLRDISNLMLYVRQRDEQRRR